MGRHNEPTNYPKTVPNSSNRRLHGSSELLVSGCKLISRRHSDELRISAGVINRRRLKWKVVRSGYAYHGRTPQHPHHIVEDVTLEMWNLGC
ncbi:hypothetical protein K0M31_012692 [Melipona bicolor]|uniref:Uncharacterized protein n=1 Tax=Melipona bicolor TaxID=60889 RepID=A0AA40FJ06_9HYME|nr:hypothetical protein K0M31_012692 [Melipona bicolor]